MRLVAVQAAQHQRGFWVDRISPGLVQVGVGTHVVIIERAAGEIPRRPIFSVAWTAVSMGVGFVVALLVDTAGLLP